MTDGILSKLIDEIRESQAEVRAENYVMVSVRPGDKVAAMLSLLSKLSGKAPTALVTDEISNRLATYAASSPDNAEAILEAAEMALTQDGAYGFQKGSALDHLVNAGVIEVDDPLKNEFRNSDILCEK